MLCTLDTLMALPSTWQKHAKTTWQKSFESLRLLPAEYTSGKVIQIADLDRRTFYVDHMWTTSHWRVRSAGEVRWICQESIASRGKASWSFTSSFKPGGTTKHTHTHTGGLALNHYKKLHYIFSAKNLSTTQFFLRSILAFLSIMLILFCILFVICLSKPMIHRCYLHAIEAIVGGETIWNNMKQYETIWNNMKQYETVWNNMKQYETWEKTREKNCFWARVELTPWPPQGLCWSPQC